jgi:acylphosphatase
MKRFQILFSGHVQGVGFRYTAKQISRSFEVVGTVQNLLSGKVKMVVEAEEDEVERFIEAICESTSGHISKIERKVAEPNHQFVGFEIVR